jgi:hypothetical protein
MEYQPFLQKEKGKTLRSPLLQQNEHRQDVEAH